MNPFVLLNGDAAAMLDLLPDASVQCCVTSPPYFGLRNYGHEGQIGLEKTPEEYVASLVNVFSEVWRALKPDGTLWLNLGDSYSNAGTRQGDRDGGVTNGTNGHRMVGDGYRQRIQGLKNKDLIGIPWMVAFALRSVGWYLRSDIIWHKPNPMPESVTDRPTRAHEYLFLLTKSTKYYYDAAAIAEPLTCMRMRGSGPMVNPGTGRNDAATGTIGDYRKRYTGKATKDYQNGGAQDASATKARIVDRILSGEITTRNKRSVWEVVPASFKGAHFATFPPKLIQPCILAGSRPGDVVLDPFLGSGTTAEVALSLGRKCYGIELNPEYLPLIHKRVAPHLPKRAYTLEDF